MSSNKLSSSELTHVLAYKFSEKLNVHLKNQGIEKIKLQYGMEILFRNMSKLILVMSLSVVLGIFWKTLIVLISYNVLRSQAYGIHARTSTGCLTSSIIAFVLSVFITKNIEISNIVVIGCFILFTCLLSIYAPADTEKRPLVGKSIRKELKRKSIIASLFLMGVALLTSINHIKTLIVLGAMIEVITVLPITYYILKRRRNNHENYERNY